MKKLNITKEAFEKSRYFTRKYGKLEYISESGKVFKTNKGKVLKFKESNDKSRIERFCATLEKQYDTMTYDEIEGKLKSAGFVLDEYGGGQHDLSYGPAYAIFVHDCGIVVSIEYRFERSLPGKDSWHAEEVTDFEWYDEPDYQRHSTESTKKFGRKFNEGAYHDKHYLTIRDYDKLPDEEKANYVEPMFGIGMVVNLTDKFYKNTDMYGRMEPKTGWRIKEARYMKRSKIWDYYIVNDDSLGDGFWAEEDWICDEYDESTKKKFGKKSVKESVGDVSTDPAYECPWCGSHDCEFEDAEEPGTAEGYFDGAKFNAQFYCKSCGETYNVKFEMNVVGVSAI